MERKKLISMLMAAAMSVGTLSVSAADPEDLNDISGADVGESIKLGDFAESAAETQKLIDNRPDVQRQMEALDRGVVAVRTGSDVLVSWRWLGTESAAVKYNVYRNGEKLNAEPLNATNYMDNTSKAGDKYTVTAVVDGVEGKKSKEAEILENGYIEVPLEVPTDVKMIPSGDTEVNANDPYMPCEASVADLDGDKEYEIVLKWDPRYVPDASKTGYSGNCLIDAYELDGTRMWRISMGSNIRAGAHDTQFIVYDFDNDGKAEMACRTADGTVAGDGTVIGDAEADWAALNNGKNLQGPLFLTVFNGEDGSIMDTIPYNPQTSGDGWDHTDWGDGYGNRSERYLGGLACVDGEHTSFLQARGYYTGGEGPLGGRTVIGAYHIEDKKIVTDWVFDTKEYENNYIGKGNHSMSTADVDYDGKDEIIYGALVLDDNGTPLYSTPLGHGDAQHTGDLVPSRPGLETFSVHEWSGDVYTYEMRDSRTGEILWGENISLDNGRGCAADIDPNHEGVECWSLAKKLVTSDGTVLATSFSLPINFAAWWDGELGRELQDETRISKYNTETMAAETIFKAEGCTSSNSGKATPVLTADILGDWREEVIYSTVDGSALRIYITGEPTNYRIPTLMHDSHYRNQVATQNVCYNQPTHTGFYLGYDTEEIPVPQMFTVENGVEVRNPDLAKKSWSIDELSTQQKQELVIGSSNARVNGKMVKIADVVPYINAEERTMVPLRFIAEAFGCKVEYDDATRGITITGTDTEIKMTVEDKAYTVNNQAMEMDTVPVIENERTLVPVRMVAEGLGKVVEYYNGLIVIADEDATVSAPETDIAVIESAVPAEAVSVDAWGMAAEITAVTATVNEDDAANVIDGDFTTTWKGEKGDSITLDMGRWGSITAAGVAFADGKPHTVKIETGSGEKWSVVAPEFTFDGDVNEKLDYIIGITKYHNGIRLTCLDDYGMEISEAAVIEVD